MSFSTTILSTHRLTSRLTMIAMFIMATVVLIHDPHRESTSKFRGLGKGMCIGIAL
jgi:hypothetical protein